MNIFSIFNKASPLDISSLRVSFEKGFSSINDSTDNLENWPVKQEVDRSSGSAIEHFVGNYMKALVFK